ncbi:MAG TPA: autotransporter domain-containing protein [Rhizomicrobium sp.]|jgi:hypothetical protein
MLSVASFAVLSGQALADTTINTNVNTPVSTSSDGNITIGTDGSVEITTNPPTAAAVTIDSSNTVTNNGKITYTGVTDAIGIEMITGNTGEFSSTTSVDLTGDGDDKSGIEISGPSGDVNSGTFTGVIPSGGTSPVAVDLATGSTLSVQGDTSFGINELSGTNIVGDIDVAGAISMTPTDANSTSTGVGNVIAINLAGSMTGNLNIQSGAVITAEGQGAEGVQTLGTLTGSIVNDGILQTFGTPNAVTNSSTAHPEAASALAIGGSVTGGIYNNGPSTTTDTTTVRSTISTVGEAPAILINPTIASSTPTTSLVIGVFNDATDPGNSFLNRGSISGGATDADVSVTTFSIVGASPTVETIFNGGFFNGGTISAVAGTDTRAATVSANALLIGDYTVIPMLTNSNESNSGLISAAVSGPESGSAMAIDIASHGYLPIINNGGTISATVTTTDPQSVTGLSAYAIYDGSGTLNTIINSGSIIASATPLANNAQVTQAANLSVNTSGVTFTNTGTVDGAILFGAGDDTLTVTGSAQQAASVNGNISFGGTTSGGGLDDLSIGAFGTVTGAVTETLGSRVNVFIDQGGVLNLENTPTNLPTVTGLFAGSFAMAGGASLGLVLSQPFNLVENPQTGAIISANSANIANDSIFNITFGSFIDSTNGKPATFDLLSTPKGALTVSSTELTIIQNDFSNTLPFLFNGDLCTWNINNASSCGGGNPGDSELVLELSPKSVQQLGLTGFAAKMFPYANEALVNDDQLGAALINGVTNAQQAQTAYADFAPDVSGADRALAVSLTDEASNVVAARQRTLREYANQDGDLTLWGQQFVQRLSQANTSEGNGYNDSGFGFALGADEGDADIGRYGAAFTFFSGGLSAKAPLESKTNSEWYMLTGYTDWHGQVFFLDSQASVGYARLAGRRSIDIQGIDRSADNTRPAEYMAGGVTAGVQYDAAGIALMPQLSLDGLAMREEGYTEANGGDGVDLHVEPYYAASLRTFAGVDARDDINFGDILLQPDLRAGYRYDFANGQESLKANFESVVPLDQFSISGPKPPAGNAVAGGGFAVSTGAWSIGVGFDYLYANSGNTSEEGTITLLGRI